MHRFSAPAAAFDVPSSAWPSIPVAEWQATRDTLHLWSQVVGKVPDGEHAAGQPLVEHDRST